MKKFITLLIITVLCLACFGCGKTEIEYVYVDNYREIDVSKLTNDNFVLRHHSNSQSPIYISQAEFAKNKAFYYQLDELFIGSKVLILNDYVYQETINYNYTGRYFAIANIEIQEIRVYDDFTMAIYNLTLRYNLKYNVDTKELEDANGTLHQMTKLDYVDLFFKDKSNVVFDLLLYKN